MENIIQVCLDLIYGCFNFVLNQSDATVDIDQIWDRASSNTGSCSRSVAEASNSITCNLRLPLFEPLLETFEDNQANSLDVLGGSQGGKHTTRALSVPDTQLLPTVTHSGYYANVTNFKLLTLWQITSFSNMPKWRRAFWFRHHSDRETERMNMERIIIKVVKSKHRLRLRGTTVLVCCNLLDDDKVLAGLVFQNHSRVKTYRNMTTAEEVIGYQPEVDVVHIPLKGSGVFGCYKVGRGWL